MSPSDFAGPRTMTAEALLALPDDGVFRELMRGELRERGPTIRDRFHCRVAALITSRLLAWLESQPRPRGQVLSGKVGFLFRGGGDSVVGIDVAYVSADLLAATGPKQAIFDGAPVLAVEILSPSDQHEDIVEKVELYLESGVVVWVIDPDFRTVSVHRPGRPVTTYNHDQELVGDPELPGFRVSVARICGG